MVFVAVSPSFFFRLSPILFSFSSSSSSPLLVLSHALSSDFVPSQTQTQHKHKSILLSLVHKSNHHSLHPSLPPYFPLGNTTPIAVLIGHDANTVDPSIVSKGIIISHATCKISKHAPTLKKKWLLSVRFPYKRNGRSYRGPRGQHCRPLYRQQGHDNLTRHMQHITHSYPSFHPPPQETPPHFP